jgi:IS5 family transposase
VLREVERKMGQIDQAIDVSSLTLNRLHEQIQRAKRIRTQAPKDKNKLYALHAPEVECISTAKPGNPTSSACNLHAQTASPPPYDGHTLNEQLEQVTISNSHRRE